jgi:hypothetical protein
VNPARSCCCVSSPCSCGTGTGGDAFVPISGTQFIYEVEFPGSTGRVQLSSVVSGTQVLLGDLPNNQDPLSGPTGGVFCSSSCVSFLSTAPCTFIGGTCVNGTLGLECNVDGDALQFLAGPNAYIEDIDIEYTTTSCGFELSNDSSIWLALYLIPYPNACAYPIQYVCVDNECVAVVGPDQCAVAAFDIMDSIKPTYWGGGCCHPWLIYAAHTLPGLEVGDPYSTAGTIRFTWNGTLAGGSFVQSLTASTNGPTGSPTITAANSYYRHRGRSTSACASAASGSTNVCTSVPLMGGITGDGCGACLTDDCCCETEIAIQFRVWQTYYTRGFVSISAIGNITGPHHISNTITAYYRGCHDPRLYSTNGPGLPTRTMKLDRVTIGLASIPEGLIIRKQWSKYGGYNPPNDCLLADIGTVSTPHSFSVVVDSTSCGCTTQVDSCSSITAARAMEMGVPGEITVTRVTP